MKNIFSLKTYLVLLFSMLFNLTFAQEIDRSKAPLAGKPTPINIGKAETFELSNGLKVFFTKDNNKPTISFSIGFDLPPMLEKDKVGLNQMAASLMQRGTEKRSKEQIDQELDFVGASFMVGDGFIFGSSLIKHKDVLLDIAADVLLNPSFPEAELEKIKKENLTGLQSMKSNANQVAARIAQKLYYGSNHPYGEFMTEASIKAITREDCKMMHKKRFLPNVGYLSISGDMTKEDAKKWLEKYFGKWQKGTVETSQMIAVAKPEKTAVALIQKDGAVQSVIQIGYPVDFKMNSKDYFAAILMNQMLGGGGFSNRLIQNIREDKGYTYGVRSSLSADKYVGSFTTGASVRTGVTDSAVVEFFKEMKIMANEKVTADFLALHKSVAIGNFARSLENKQTVARFAINTAIENLSPDFYAKYLQNINAVTIDDIQNMAKRYLDTEKAYIIVVGDVAAIRAKMEKFGKVTEYDINGVEVVKSDFSAGDMTAEKVFEKYVEAIGGKQKISAVKSLQVMLNQSIQTMNIKMTAKRKDNKMMCQVMVLPNGMGEMKTILNGDKAKMVSMAGAKVLTETEVNDMKVDALLFLEMSYKDANLKIELTGAKDIEGAKTHEVTVTYPSGKKGKRYYDVKTGLLLSKVDEKGSAVYSDYQAFDGIMFFTKGKVESPQGQVGLTVEKVEVNVNLADADFAVE